MQMRRGNAIAAPHMRNRTAEPMLEGICKAMRTGSPEEKLDAILTIVSRIESGSITPQKALGLLEGAMEDESRPVRWSAVMAMSKFGPVMMAGLRKGLSSNDANVRSMSAAMIDITLARDPNTHRSTMQKRDEGAAETCRALFRTLLDSQQSARVHALGALRELARRSPLETLDEMNAFSGLVCASECGNLELNTWLQKIRQDAAKSVQELGCRMQA